MTSLHDANHTTERAELHPSLLAYPLFDCLAPAPKGPEAHRM